MENKSIVGYEIPTIQELLETVNYERRYPATDLEFAIVKDWVHHNGENTNEYLWSCTPKCETTYPHKWVVHFRNGRTTYTSESATLAVRFRIIYDDGSNGWTKVYSSRNYENVLKLLKRLNNE